MKREPSTFVSPAHSASIVLNSSLIVEKIWFGQAWIKLIPCTHGGHVQPFFLLTFSVCIPQYTHLSLQSELSILPSGDPTRMKIGIVCYPTYGGSGVVATELGKALASKGHQIHFISYAMPMRLDGYLGNIFYHEVEMSSYPLFEFPLYTPALASNIVEVAGFE